MSKISQYSALTSPASADALPVVDVDDLTMAASGTTKKVTAGTLVASQTAAWYNVKNATYGAVGDGSTDDTAAIQAAITAASAANGGVVYLPSGTYKISSALTLHTQVILQGDSIGQSFSLGGGGGPTVIKQTSTTAHGIYQNDATQTGIRDLMLLGPSSGSGDGIHLTWTSNTNVYQVDMQNVMVSSFGGNGVYANTLLGTNARMVICTYNGGDGFHLVNTNTSCVWDSCAAPLNTGYGWYVSGCNYITFNGCAADGNANGWYFTGCQSVTLNGCGTEGNTTDGLTLHDGYAYTVNGFWVSHHNYGVHVASGCFGAILSCITEVGLSGAVYGIYAESGSVGIILAPSAATATNIPYGYWQEFSQASCWISSPVVEGVTYLGGGTDTSGTATASSPTFVSGTAKQCSTTQDVVLYIAVQTAAALAVAIGPTSTPADTIMPSQSYALGLQTIRVPKGWYVKITGTIADLTITQVTC